MENEEVNKKLDLLIEEICEDDPWYVQIPTAIVFILVIGGINKLLS